MEVAKFKLIECLNPLFLVSTGRVHPLRTASVTHGFRTRTWCAFVGRLSPLQRPVSRNSWPTSSVDEKRWPPSTKFSCAPTRAHHIPPPVPTLQMCQHHPSHQSPSEHRLLNMSCWDFKMRLWATVSGGTIKFAGNGQDRKKTSRNQQWLGSMELSSSSSLILKEKSFAL